MSTATEKMPVACPQCGKQLMVPVTAAGKQGRCPACSTVFPLLAPVAAEAVPDLQPIETEPDYNLQPLATEPNPYGAPVSAPAPTGSAYPYGSQPPKEKPGWWGSMLGGVAMMVIAVVWFFGALFLADRIFFYPPILFIIGLVTFCRGIFSGNVAGD